jgi:phosphoesterase RecJ-like protein
MENIDFEGLKRLVKQFVGGRVMLSFHSIGDTDAVASAMALSGLFASSSIATPDKISYNMGRILQKLDYKSKIPAAFSNDSDLIVLLDVNNFEDCGSFSQKLSETKIPILIIDHHSPSKIKKDNVYVFNDESYTSTTSIVYKLLKSLGAQVDQNIAKLLSLGIISDSAEFKNSSALTFVQLGELFNIAKTDYDTLLNEFFYTPSAETRASIISELFNSNVAIKNDTIFLYGSTSVHPGSTADIAIKMGADVAIFRGENDKGVSFSTRLRSGLDKKYEIDLGKIMKKLSRIIKGSGGGHPCAAGAYGSAKESGDAFVEYFILEVLKHIKQKRQK